MFCPKGHERIRTSAATEDLHENICFQQNLFVTSPPSVLAGWVSLMYTGAPASVCEAVRFLGGRCEVITKTSSGARDGDCRTRSTIAAADSLCSRARVNSGQNDFQSTCLEHLFHGKKVFLTKKLFVYFMPTQDSSEVACTSCDATSVLTR